MVDSDADAAGASSWTGRITGDVEYDLTNRLGALEAKVAADHASGSRRFGAMAGVVGLAISIATGLFTLYDRLVTKPAEVHESEYNQLKSDIRLIISTNQELFEKANSASSDSVKMNIAGSGNAQVQSLMEDATRILALLKTESKPDSRFRIGSYDYNILSQAAYSGGNVPLAITYASRSVETAANPHSKAEALRTKAIMLVMANGDGSIGEARQTIKQALDILATRNDPAAAFDKATVYSTGASIEANNGHCAEAVANAQQAMTLVADPSIPPGSKQFVVGGLAGGLAGQTRCPLTEFPEGVRRALNIRVADTSAMPSAPGIPSASVIPPAIAAAPIQSPPVGVRLTLSCRFRSGPRAGELQSYAGLPGVQPVPVGSPCQDGRGSFGVAE